jgi:hypothetical protein
MFAPKIFSKNVQECPIYVFVSTWIYAVLPHTAKANLILARSSVHPLRPSHHSPPTDIRLNHCKANLSSMKLESGLLGYADLYEPWDRPALRSNKKIRPKHRPLPAAVVTCWELNTGARGLTSEQVTTCTPCQLFQQEKALTPRLRKLCSNTHCAGNMSNVPVRFRCDTPWALVSTPSCDKKRKPEAPALEAASLPIEPIQAAPNTPKRARTTRTLVTCRSRM